MKVNQTIIGRWIGSLLLAVLLTGCQNDAADDVVSEGSPLRLSSVTRATSTPMTSGTVKLFVMSPEKQFSAGIFTYNNGWQNNGATVKENAQYYLYGYSPSTYSGSISKPTDVNFSGGANLTLTGLPLMTEDDVCVVVGVQRFTTAVETSATEGSYGYLAGLTSENYVNLLLDHLYSRLKLQFNVDKDYYALRRIHLISVVLKAAYSETVTATVMLRDGHGITDNITNYVTYSAPAAAGSRPVQLFTMLTGQDQDLPMAGAEGGPFAIGETVNCPQCLFNDGQGAYLSIESIYDIYDTTGQKTRGNCKSVNKINISGMYPGVSRTLTLTVAPTYLYVLGDNDVDNPTITLQ